VSADIDPAKVFCWGKARSGMAPFRLLVALLLILALAFGGCAARTAPTPTSTTASGGLVPVQGGPENETAPKGPQPSAATLNLTQDPVDIQEEGELTSGIDKEWTWHVAPGFKSFTVALSFFGPQGSPVYTLTRATYDLTGGDPPQNVAHWDATGSSTSGCAVCMDGAELEGVAGQWRLQFDAAPSAAEYSLHIQVTY